jgi:hypothetical protein
LKGLHVLLSDVIARLTDETTVMEVLLGLDDLPLLAKLRARADENGLTLGAYASWAFRTYADNASSEEWTTLIGVMGRSADPGSACLTRAFAYMIAGEGAPNHGPALDV